MIEQLTNAPLGKTLVLEEVNDPGLALRLHRMGLFEGSEIIRLDVDVLIQPVRVRGPDRDSVLGGGMATKIVVHLEDGRKLPLVEMKPGETGHIEGLIGGPSLSRTLDILGLKINHKITLVRHLPPMEYVSVIEKGRRIRLTEGMATKIWGRMESRDIQFVSAQTGKKFYIKEILGGKKVGKMLKLRGVEPGKVLILEEVAPAHSLRLGIKNPLIISSREGLRLFLQPKDAERILVSEAGESI